MLEITLVKLHLGQFIIPNFEIFVNTTVIAVVAKLFFALARSWVRAPPGRHHFFTNNSIHILSVTISYFFTPYTLDMR